MKTSEMKQREECLVNMCHAQLLSRCLPAMLQAPGLHCGHRGSGGGGGVTIGRKANVL